MVKLVHIDTKITYIWSSLSVIDLVPWIQLIIVFSSLSVIELVPLDSQYPKDWNNWKVSHELDPEEKLPMVAIIYLVNGWVGLSVNCRDRVGWVQV